GPRRRPRLRCRSRARPPPSGPAPRRSARPSSPARLDYPRGRAGRHLCARLSDRRPMPRPPFPMYAFSQFEGGSMRRFARELLGSQSGQGLSEYLIIVALVAIAAIGVVTVFGRDIRELFAGTTDSLAGNQASNTARKANVKASKNLKNFGKYTA